MNRTTRNAALLIGGFVALRAFTVIKKVRDLDKLHEGMLVKDVKFTD